MQSTWQHQDIIDFEYFLHLDEKNSSQEEMVYQRDRQLYLDIIAGDKDLENAPKAHIFHEWLKFRRMESKRTETILPGELYRDIFQLLRIIFLGIGLLLGSGLAFSFFTYTGSAPLNVFHFLVAFILSQVLLLIIFFLSSTLQAGKNTLLTSSLLYSTLAKTLIRLFISTRKHLLNQMVAKNKNSFQTALGIIQGKKQYGVLFYWPLFIRMQLLGVGFNLGLIGVTLLKVITTDLAFGWQSTIQFSSETIHTFVRLLSLPWSWYLENPYPTLAKIEGSRMILKDGIYHLSTQDLTSWWPFLTCALLVYGLFPRICLLMSGLILERRALRRLAFDQASHDRLHQRMRTPHVSTQAAPEEEKKATASPREVLPSGDEKKHQETTFAPTELLVMIPDECDASCPDEILHDILSRKGYNPFRRIRFGDDFEKDQQIVAELSETDLSNTGGILILMEAWMPPITDFTAFLGGLREAVAPRTIIRIGLLGKPDSKTIFTPVRRDDFHVWKQKITTLGDPYLRVENVVTPSIKKQDGRPENKKGRADTERT